jgi:hypothetical protein
LQHELRPISELRIRISVYESLQSEIRYCEAFLVHRHRSSIEQGSGWTFGLNLSLAVMGARCRTEYRENQGHDVNCSVHVANLQCSRVYPLVLVFYTQLPLSGDSTSVRFPFAFFGVNAL